MGLFSWPDERWPDERMLQDHHRHGLHFTGIDFHQYGGPDDIGEASRALPDAEDAEKHTPCGLKKVIDIPHIISIHLVHVGAI